jgi:hypothetical protein
MAGRGPAPKNPDERARSNVPDRGEWSDLPPLTKPVLPALPKRTRAEGPWSSRTTRAWKAWRADWVTGAYGPAEVAQAVELAYLYEDAVRDPRAAWWAEVRQWMDRLGLTMKGKRDLRLRQASGETAKFETRGKRKRFAELRLVGDDDGGAA